MEIEINGVLVEKHETQNITSTFKKRMIIVRCDDKEYFLNLINDKVDIINDFDEGDEVVVKFVISCNSYPRNDKTSYFTNLNVLNISDF